VLGCSSSDDDAVDTSVIPRQPAADNPAGEAIADDATADDATADGSAADGSAAVDEGTETAVDALNPGVVLFRDTNSNFATSEVYDATREIVRFDAEHAAMVSAATGDSVSGWMTNGNELGPVGAFRVRFGSEGGERRAYFTETANGTICDIVLSGPETIRIFGTSERPPMN
jgi:hypothetical protein